MKILKGLWKFLKNVGAQLHRFVLWTLILIFFWGWIYTFVGDTTRAKKVMIYVDAYELDGQTLTERLEDMGLPEGIKMIQVRSFANHLVSSTIEGDVYVIRESMLLSALEETPGKLMPIGIPAGFTGYEWEGETWGVRVYDASTGTGVASDCILYALINGPEPENYYLCFDAKSPHLEDGAVWQVVMNLLSLDD